MIYQPIQRRTMRLSIWLFISLLYLQLPVYSLQIEPKVSISGTYTLQKIFQKIEQQTGKRIFYANSILDDQQKVNIKAVNNTIPEVLSQILAGKKLEWSIEPKFITIVAIKNQPILKSTFTEADTTITVTGRVTNEKGEPVIGATVVAQGTRNAVTTGTDGSFVAHNVRSNSSLIISSIGYSSQEISYKKKGSLGNIQLKEYVGKLDEMVIIAYGTTTKRFNTGDVVTVKAEEIEKQPVNNPLLALEGRVPGMEITQSTGLAGSGVKIRIRGQNSYFNGNDPLYIIDGVPYTPQLLKNLGSILGGSGNESTGIYGSPLSYINPNDIESIDILKDADATAIYGSRAANGAVLITTKKGKPGQTKVDVNIQRGIGKVTRKIDLLNTRQYLDMRYEALKNDNVTIGNGIGGDIDLTKWDTTRYTDWQKVLIGGTAHYNEARASISGGNSTTQYLIGGTYHKETTVFPGDFNDQKTSVHFNITSSSADERFTATFSGNYLYDVNKLLQFDLTNNINLAPNAPEIYNKDGSLNWANSTWTNPLSYLQQRFRSQTSNLISNAILGYKISKSLEVKTSFGYNNMQLNEVNVRPHSSVDPAFWSSDVRQSNFTNNTSKTWIIEPQITYKHTIAKGELQTLAGATIQQSDDNGQILHGEKFISDKVMEDIKSAPIVTISSTTIAQYKYSAVFGRLNYNWENKYLINLTIRRDGSSRFGPENRFHNFGALGIGWILSNEHFFQKSIPSLSFAKIRGSYGVTGNDQIGNYRYMDLYYATNLSYQGIVGLYNQNLSNPLLAWEKTKKLEGGLELGFLKDRIFTSISYYKNHSSNQLTSYILPSVTGFGSIDANQDANIENRGWEFLVNTINIQSSSFRWTSSFNLSVTKNKLVSIGPTVLGIDSQYVGHPLGTFFTYHLSNVNPATGQYQFIDSKGATTTNPDYTDLTVPINLTPKFYGGFQNNFEYKNFQLSISLQFIKQIGLNNKFGNYPGGFYFGNQPVTILNRWKKTGDVAPVQRYNQDFSLYDGYSKANGSDAAYSDASFIRFRNISLSYSLPISTIQKLHLQKLRVYLQGQNLFTITKYQGGDPETRSLTSLPPLKVLTAGIQLSL
ncbi:TonB-linked outer membrane protein, SusC/RagA family [Chitinophaga sp. YR573]|nr:TonB-linked outer membrane protein, SusC/RagA family [Chitinophaga sp. YR573]